MEKEYLILIVDDIKENRILLRRIIENMNYFVQEAENGKEGLEFIKLQKPDMIISDILMPVMDGFRFCIEVKTDDNLWNIPFIFYTATYTNKKDEEFGLSLGASRYLIKPMEPDVFRKELEMIFEENEKGFLKDAKMSIKNEKDMLKLFNERLINKLDKKMLDLEQEMTEHQHAVEALRNSEHLFQVLAENSPVGIFRTDADGNTTYVNPCWCKFSGLSAQDALGNGWLSAVHPEDKEAIYAGWKQATQARDVSVSEYRFAHSDGTIVWVMGQAVTEMNSENQIIGYVGTITDITERKQNEKQILLTRDTLELLNSNNETNDSLEEILKSVKTSTGIEAVGMRLQDGDEHPYYKTIGFPQEWIQTKRFTDAKSIHGNNLCDEQVKPLPECICEKIIHRNIDSSKPYFTKSGSFWTNNMTKLLVSISDDDFQFGTCNLCISEGYESIALIPLCSNENNIGLLQLNDRRCNQFTLEMIHFFEGLTSSISISLKRKQAEEQIKRDLEEKQTLLRELYHRTKNNMQVISSILKAKARDVKDEFIKTAFAEIINKINSMSLVHQKLYQAKDLSRINLKEYIQDIVRMLMISYSIQSGQVNVKLELEDVYVLIDTAIPLGLVLNEMISNVFKHAFPDDLKGEIHIRLFKNDQDEINLLIADNGIGIPVDMDLRNGNSMGLRTMFMLIDYQLSGEVSYQNEKGLKWFLIFKDSEKKARV
jgi:PAS domain S-box-containing protein